MELLKVNDVNKQFGGFKALDNISISISEKNIYGLLGPNGAGKTTLIRIINQITGPDSGELFFKGAKLNQKHIKVIGYLPEERVLYKKMKVGEQALYFAQLKGLTRYDALTKLKYWFEKFELQAWWNNKIEELSKGMQQKVQFIITILHEPELLIFDEPFSGFDPINVNLIKNEILNFRDKGATIIFSTHNMASVEELCDNIALINKAKKILEGSVTDIKQKYKSNIFEISYKGGKEEINRATNNNIEILETTGNNGLCSVKIKLKNNIKTNDLLQLLLPHIQIQSFNEILPSMNDIFIQRVENDKVIN
ncbi:MAG: ATP-binding cassette domain-containing protein [Bacteroidales bacterium]|nr:ATP-binding cassette domain-containing protein [Bacteroidales bacterium]